MRLSRVPLLIWFLMAALVIVGVGVWFFSRPSVLGEAEGADGAKPVAVSTPVEGTQEFEIVGRDHITQGTPGSGYNSNPPTSGPHWPGPAKNGVYDNSLPDETLIHNMEHGYVWISYKPDASEEVKNKLKDIVNEDDWKVVLSPREGNDSKIALVAWGRLLKMDDLDEGKVRDFIKTYRNRGPEKTPE